MDDISKIYFLRHQESMQNRNGFGDVDTELTRDGKEAISNLSEFIENISIGNINLIIAGNLKRHRDTLEILIKETGYKGKVISDKRLNAMFKNSLITSPAQETEEKYRLDRFKPNCGDIYYGFLNEKMVAFDPKKLGIYPFDPLYSAVYVDRKMREIVFPDKCPIKSFAEIVDDVKEFQTGLIELVKDAEKPLNIVAISSCSASGFNLEYAASGTIGNHMLTRFGSEQRPVFPQSHDEVMVLGYKPSDERLHAVEGNVKIKNYLK